MNAETKKWYAKGEAMGYEVEDHVESAPWRVWVRIDSARIRLIDLKAKEAEVRVPRFGKAPVVIHENTINGRSRYRTYGGDDIGEPDVIEDYASKKGRENWHRYVMEKDRHGNVIREGPMAFRSKKERLEYERITGQERRDPGSAAQVNVPDEASVKRELDAKVDKFVQEKLKELS